MSEQVSPEPAGGAQAVSPSPGAHRTPAAHQPVPDAPAREALSALRAVERALRTATPPGQRRRASATRAEHAMLACVSGAPETLSVSALATRLHLDPSTASVTVSRLAGWGLLRRTPVPGDGRRRSIALTAAGRRMAERAPDGASTAVERALAALPPDDARELVALVQRLAGALRGDAAP